MGPPLVSAQGLAPDQGIEVAVQISSSLPHGLRSTVGVLLGCPGQIEQRCHGWHQRVAADPAHALRHCRQIEQCCQIRCQALAAVAADCLIAIAQKKPGAAPGCGGLAAQRTGRGRRKVALDGQGSHARRFPDFWALVIVSYVHHRPANSKNSLGEPSHPRRGRLFRYGLTLFVSVATSTAWGSGRSVPNCRGVSNREMLAAAASWSDPAEFTGQETRQGPVL